MTVLTLKTDSREVMVKALQEAGIGVDIPEAGFMPYDSYSVVFPIITRKTGKLLTVSLPLPEGYEGEPTQIQVEETEVVEGCHCNVLGEFTDEQIKILPIVEVPIEKRQAVFQGELEQSTVDGGDV